MPAFYSVKLNTRRNLLLGLPEPLAAALAREQVAALLRSPSDVVSDGAMLRYLSISPPIAAVIPEFQRVVDEIEFAYVAGMFFSAVAAASVSIERMLNAARIGLHPYHPTIGALHGKGPCNSWKPNIDALENWGYFQAERAAELRHIYDDIRNPYLHSGPIRSVETDAKRVVDAAYHTITVFLGFPQDLFTIAGGFECLNPSDPRFKVFYAPALRRSEPNDAV